MFGCDCLGSRFLHSGTKILGSRKDVFTRTHQLGSIKSVWVQRAGNTLEHKENKKKRKKRTGPNKNVNNEQLKLLWGMEYHQEVKWGTFKIKQEARQYTKGYGYVFVCVVLLFKSVYWTISHQLNWFWIPGVEGETFAVTLRRQKSPRFFTFFTRQHLLDKNQSCPPTGRRLSETLVIRRTIRPDDQDKTRSRLDRRRWLTIVTSCKTTHLLSVLTDNTEINKYKSKKWIAKCFA